MNMTTPISAPVARHIPARGGRAIPFPLHPTRQIVAGADLPANVSLVETEIAAKTAGAPPHKHTHEDEIYVVLDGEITFLMGDDVVTAGPGDTIVLPRGGWHGTWNEGDAPARALTFITQDSPFEHFFDKVAEAARGKSPEEGPAIVGQISAEMGVTIDMGRLPERAKPFFGVA
ncbi:MAG: cupin domain-containing protein [Pseudomonadota bacterium]